MVIIVIMVKQITTQVISRFNTLSINLLDEVKNEYINVSKCLNITENYKQIQ